MNYEKLLNHQPMLNPKIRAILEGLLTGTLSVQQLHNRKYYAKKQNHLLVALEYNIALEIYNMIGK